MQERIMMLDTGVQPYPHWEQQRRYDDLVTHGATGQETEKPLMCAASSASISCITMSTYLWHASMSASTLQPCPLTCAACLALRTSRRSPPPEPAAPGGREAAPPRPRGQSAWLRGIWRLGSAQRRLKGANWRGSKTWRRVRQMTCARRAHAVPPTKDLS